MVADGVESLRFEIDWATIQPYRTWSDVPARALGSSPTSTVCRSNLRALDQLVGLAAQRGLSLRPIVIDAPNWDAGGPAGLAAPPRCDSAPYGTFLTALVHRYGPRGSFWRTPGHRRCRSGCGRSGTSRT